ncbi:MAG TPA: 30S ribosomal protein S20 [Oscillospiraceae bacterium]|nr:30S ribosomal protein S20 [Oscillospiraceae bacterium]
MANIKSAKKRVLVNTKKTIRNKALKTNLKTVLKRADFALTNNAEDRDAAVKVAIKKIDSSVAKGILHKNTAARKKSALTLKLNASNVG